MQLAEPRGLLGRALAHIMDRTNAVPLAQTISVVKSLQPKDILEVGFGSGRGIVALLDACVSSRICGIDRSADMVARASARVSRMTAGREVQLKWGRADDLPWEADTFDCVMAVNVAYFFAGAGHEMAEIFRVLRPGGRLVAYVTRNDAMARWPFASSATHRHFDESSLMLFLNQAMLRDVTITAVALPLGITGLIACGTKPD